jgi:hypothetical protein
LDPIYEISMKPYIDSEFYTDNNGDGVIHIPVMFGDDETFQSAKYTFKFGYMLMYWFQKRSLELYGVEIDIKYSTVDDYLMELKKENYVY